MDTMTDAELTILSLLAEGEHYGHEIQQLIDERGLREWVTIGFSSVFYILNKLEKQNLLTSELRHEERGPGRKLFSITEGGRGVLQTAISDLLRQPRALGSGFELGLVNLSVLKPQQVYVTLRHHLTDLRHRLQLVEQSWQRHQASAEEPATHIRALYTHSIAIMHAEVEWLDVFVKDWEQRYPAVKTMYASDENPVVTTHNKVTQLHRRPTPEPDKMLQRLRRPKAPNPNEDATPDTPSQASSEDDTPEA